jgi:hypothetical protein
MPVTRLGARLNTVSDRPPEDEEQWNAAKIRSIPVSVSGIDPGDSLVYDGAELSPGGGNRYRTVLKAADYVVEANIDAVLVDASSGDVTVTLPVIDSFSRRVYVKKVDTSPHLVYVVGQGGSTVDGDPAGYLEFPLAYVQVVSYGGSWWALNC